MCKLLGSRGENVYHRYIDAVFLVFLKDIIHYHNITIPPYEYRINIPMRAYPRTFTPTTIAERLCGYV